MSWLHAPRRRRTAAPRRPRARIEPLEARIAPATFAGTGGPALDITLDHAGEAITIVATPTSYTVNSNFVAVDGGQTGGHVTGFSITSTSIDTAAFTTIHITDSSTG
ncbi:MAG TPA: hypothetical protein VGO11_26440, partial [Chthoniobacteraceae bacterium]|nr:hypothetical protein [Chthoniobacteraceae bacterium]